MSITDELRGYFGKSKGMFTDYVLAIADRIDAEHDKALNSVDGAYDSGYNVGYDDGFASADDWLSQHEDAMAEHGLVRLPVDADGVPWSVGDHDEDGNVVTQLRLSSDGWYVVTDGPSAYHPEQRRHYHKPTVEDVLREFTDAILEWSGKSGTVAEVGTWSDVAAEYAAKLRLAETEDA